MVVSDPTIDPITGLPVLNPSGPVQQIPLGQEVFPYADLNATAQPTRGPIYGDDIIPTSGLVTAPDKQMKPRSIQSTTTRELRVREAVFQSNGQPIADGTTAPIDVNNVGGGGVSVVKPKHFWMWGDVSLNGSAVIVELDNVQYITKYTCAVSPRSDSFANRTGTFWIQLRSLIPFSPLIYILGMGSLQENDTGNADAGGSAYININFNPFLDPSVYMQSNSYAIHIQSETFNDCNIAFSIDYL